MGHSEEASEGLRRRSVDGPKSVVILVHGIRTYAPWIALLRAQFEKENIIVVPTNYGRLDALRFLFWSRRRPLDEVWESVRETKQLYPNATISFLAHSFGTYIVARLLEREFDFKAHRVVFCGSVVHYRFPFRNIADRFTLPLINETSARDPWPVLGQSFSWGYGSAGTYGFKQPRVRDRWHRGFGHSQYLTADFCRKFWVPFFKEGEIVEGDLVDDTPPLWIRILSIVSLKYVALLAVIVLAATAAFYKPAPKYPDRVGPLGPSFENRDVVPDAASDVIGPGPRPNERCYIEQKIDSTKTPQMFHQVWTCP